MYACSNLFDLRFALAALLLTPFDLVLFWLQEEAKVWGSLLMELMVRFESYSISFHYVFIELLNLPGTTGRVAHTRTALAFFLLSEQSASKEAVANRRTLEPKERWRKRVCGFHVSEFVNQHVIFKRIGQMERWISAVLCPNSLGISPSVLTSGVPGFSIFPLSFEP